MSEQEIALAVPTGIEAVIAKAAVDPNVDMDKMRQLLDMQIEMMDREAKRDFNAAMNVAQSEMGPVSADATNPQTRSKYASYSALDSKLRPIYTRNGFSLSFDSGDNPPENHVRVLCYVGHIGGHSRTYHANMPADGKGAKGGDVMTKTHAAGAAMSYGQRYLLKLIFNVAIGEADTDGNMPGDVITADQKDNIIALMKDKKADTAKFLKHMGFETVDAIPAKEYERAINALKAKK